MSGKAPAAFASIALVLSLAAAAFSGPSRPAHSEALPDFVFRGRLAGQSEPLVFLALNPALTVAYDVTQGSLYLALRGKVVPEGHGEVGGVAGPALPQPPPGKGGDPAATIYRPEGLELHRRLAPSPWSVRGPKGPLPVTVAFRGMHAHGEIVSLAWNLRLPGGKRIVVEETPRFDDHYGAVSLFRTFEAKGIPPGDTLMLDLTGRGRPETWGGGADGGVEERGGRRYLVQPSDGAAPLKVTWSD